MDAQRAPDASGRGRPWGVLLGSAVVVGVLLVLLVALAVTTGSAGLWVAALLVAGLGLAGAAVLLARAPEVPAASSPAPPAPAVPTAPEREVDDLQAFFDSPPGSSTALPSTPALPSTAARPSSTAPPAVPEVEPPEPADRGPAPPTAGRGPVAALATAAVVLVVAAGAVAVLTDDGGREPGRDRPAADREEAPPTPTGKPSATATPSDTATPSSSAAPLNAAAAGELATATVAPGDDGFAAQLAFAGIVLEPRAVGATISYPTLRVSSDDATAVAHLELPTWNCLTAVPPVDPAAAGCSASLTEYADLPTPGLELREEDGEFQLTGTFATYTRPNGSAPAYTGRSYPITVQAGPDGRVRDGLTPAAGELELGGASAATTADRAANTVEVSD